MSTHVDGAVPSVAPDPDDDPRDDPRSTDADDIGSEWVRAEMQRRMRANRSTRGRHARAAEAASAGRLGAAPPVPRRDRPQPAVTTSWATDPVTPGDLPENYVPRHSVQTPGPAAEPAASITGPIPVVRPAADPVDAGAPNAGRVPVVPAQAAPTDIAPTDIAPTDIASAAAASAAVPPAAVPPAAAAPADIAPAAAVPAPAPADAAPADAAPAVGDSPNGRPGPGATNGHSAPGGAAGHPGPGGSNGRPAPGHPNGRPGAGGPTGPLGGPTLTGAGLPLRRRRSSGPGTPLRSNAAPPAGPWTRPGPVVPNEPFRRLGAPPGVLGDDAAVAPWGPPSPPSGLALPVRPADAEPDDMPAAVASAAPAPVDGRPTGGARGTSVDDAASVDDDVAPARHSAPDGAADGAVNGAATARAGSVVDDDADPADAVDEATRTEAARTEAARTETARQVPAEEDVASEVPAEAPAETTDEIAGGITDSPTAPHPIVAARRAALSGRSSGVPLPRPADQARTAARQVTPRPVTPRNIPVIGTAPPEPGSTRVRVVLSERKGVARPVRTIKEVQEGTAVGELLRRDLIQSQLMVTLRFAALTILVLGALPASFVLLPEISAFHVLGVRAPWLLLGVLMYPFLVGVAWRYTRVAERVEQNFADHVQD